MRGNSQARFLGEGITVTLFPYPTLIGDKANIRLTGYMVEVSWSKLPIVTRLFGYHNLRLNPYAYLGIPYMNNK